MIKALIIDDEQSSRNVLHEMLNENFKNIDVLAVCENSEEGKSAISEFHPDLVFLDIEIGEHSAFTLLQELDSINFEVIFTTAHVKYALQAIKFSALDYLLKPCELDELTAAVNRYSEKQNKNQSAYQFETLFHNIKNIQKDSKKIALPTTNGLVIVAVKDIMWCRADVNYTTFFLSNKNKIMVTKTLKIYDELLADYDFIRIHNSHLVNLHYVKNYTRGDGGFVTMNDGSSFDVSRKKKDEFLKRLAEL